MEKLRIRPQPRPLSGRILGILLSAIGAVYDLLFAWWLDELIRRKYDARLAHDMLSDMTWLFTEAGGQLEQTQSFEYNKQRKFDESYATVRTPQLHLRFMRCRGEISITARPCDSSSGWSNVEYPTDYLPTLDRLLQEHWVEIVAETKVE